MLASLSASKALISCEIRFERGRGGMEKGIPGKGVKVRNSMVCLKLRTAMFSKQLGQRVYEECPNRSHIVYSLSCHAQGFRLDPLQRYKRF